MLFRGIGKLEGPTVSMVTLDWRIRDAICPVSGVRDTLCCIQENTPTRMSCRRIRCPLARASRAPRGRSSRDHLFFPVGCGRMPDVRISFTPMPWPRIYVFFEVARSVRRGEIPRRRSSLARFAWGQGMGGIVIRTRNPRSFGRQAGLFGMTRAAGMAKCHLRCLAAWMPV